MARHRLYEDAPAHGPYAPTLLVGNPPARPAPPARRPRGTRTAAALTATAALFVAFMAGAATQNAIAPAPTPVEVHSQ